MATRNLKENSMLKIVPEYLPFVLSDLDRPGTLYSFESQADLDLGITALFNEGGIPTVPGPGIETIDGYHLEPVPARWLK